jgi:hypothetical protein
MPANHRRHARRAGVLEAIGGQAQVVERLAADEGLDEHGQPVVADAAVAQVEPLERRCGAEPTPEVLQRAVAELQPRQLDCVQLRADRERLGDARAQHLHLVLAGPVLLETARALPRARPRRPVSVPAFAPFGQERLARAAAHGDLREPFQPPAEHAHDRDVGRSVLFDVAAVKSNKTKT